ncbi:NAD(P)H-quinone dehydrogenase [Lapillicoccus jejuensis]|uniref:NAD(P)H-quinone dehydrogenase n=1 Tax=Lapillicoccus jejuensis TaxID=402171 RepID=UPI00114EC9BF|nr:NAD(P)H-quinone dehydrogenase [Lapillicoccus jejuensis]
MSRQQPSVVVLGGGPGGYEAALVAARAGAQVTVVDRDGLGGACVLTDCVPSKALVSTAAFMGGLRTGETLGVREADDATVDLAAVNRRILALAASQSADIGRRLTGDGVRIVRGRGALAGPDRVRVETDAGDDEELAADVVLVATGATPRVMPTAQPDGERILTWQQIYTLTELPEKLVVVGSGVTGAELAHAYTGLGVPVTLVSSRERVLPGEDADAAEVIEQVFRDDGMEVLGRSRMASVERTATGVRVTLVDGRTVDGSHALLAVGSVPQTAGLGLAEAGVELSESGHVVVDGVSRTSVRGVYAAGDCTGVLPLASVAAMQGRIAMWHALGDAVSPLRLGRVSANVFTSPEIATVGVSQRQIDDGESEADVNLLPLATNPRAKMDSFEHGFVKVFSRKGSGTVVGGVVVAPRASELIYPIALAVQNGLNVDQVASTFTVYPSMTGSIAEAARRLH